jgi:quercetin 2,3-dioxygenase
MTSSRDVILGTEALTFPWPMEDPFLFCAHHNDHYPAGDDELRPKASLAGRNLGSDFSGKDGFSMYHGLSVPGFPQHPHRGFETVTIARRGYIDHADSTGATARFGQGDVQWITTGAGVVHSEMFPLIHEDQDNPAELFQIWLNLPRKSKMVPPNFSMIWAGDVPVYTSTSDGRTAEVRVVAGRLLNTEPPPPPPHSWADEPGSEVQIWAIRLEEGARLRLPPQSAKARRNLYFFQGSRLTLGLPGEPPVQIEKLCRIRVRPDAELELTAESGPVEVLLLGAVPIAEPVANYGPFVMNTRQELEQAFRDYSRTQFGGWPWPSDGPVHPRDRGRFALHGDGKHETPRDEATGAE